MTDKGCSKCGLTKPVDAFSLHALKGHQAWCKECMAHVARLWRYGLSEDAALDLFCQQDGACAVCATPLDFQGWDTIVDHDHQCCSGKKSCGACIRGFLCRSCNFLLGEARDSQERLRAAADYLDRWEWRASSPR